MSGVHVAVCVGQGAQGVALSVLAAGQQVPAVAMVMETVCMSGSTYDLVIHAGSMSEWLSSLPSCSPCLQGIE